jgi:hypothetical protein
MDALVEIHKINHLFQLNFTCDSASFSIYPLKGLKLTTVRRIFLNKPLR